MFRKLPGLLDIISKNRIAKIIINALFVLSIVCFTLTMSSTGNTERMFEVYTALFVSFAVGLFGTIEYSFPINAIRRTSLLTFLLSTIVTVTVIRYVRAEFWQRPVTKHLSSIFAFFKEGSFFGQILYIAFGIFVFLVINYAAARIIEFLTLFFAESSKAEKYIFLIGSALLAAVISVAYSQTTGFWQSFDKVYSIDSGYNTSTLFPQLYYADIRHVGFSVLSFPLYSIANFFAELFKIDGMRHILLSFFNAELLLLSALLLRRMTNNNNYMFALYFASAPTWIFTLFFEKYTLSVFCMVLFTYGVYRKKAETTLAGNVLGAATISTSAALIPLAALCEGKTRDALKRIAQASLMLVLLFVVIGRIDFMIHFKELTDTMTYFTDPELTMLNKFYLTIETIASTIFILPFTVKSNNTFMWYDGLGATMNWVGFAILIISIIGFLSNIKKDQYKIFIYWVVFLFFLFMVIGFSVYHGPLFALYFSWAFIPLFVSGVEALFRKKTNYAKYALIGVIAIALILNIYHLGHLMQYMKAAFPV